MAEERRGAGATPWSRWAPDILGVLWVLGAAAAVLVPAVVHGSSLGSFDLLSRFGLTQQAGVVVHNGQATDQISEMIPWTSLAWTQVHHGQVPLWNPYSALGLPLAFNWQSATFSVPALLGYLAPMRLAYTVQVFASLFIAGTGVYVLGRVLRLGVLGCVTAATIYELSGPMMGFLGWPIAGVMSWAGWIFAAAVIVIRGRHRLRAVSFFAVVLACAFYAGQPGTVALLVVATAVFVVVLLVRRARDSGQGDRGVLRPVVDLAAASVIGIALAAPLILPGAQLLSQSVFRDVQRTNQALPAQDLVYLVVQGFNGLPLSHIQFFSVGTTAYVGVIGLVLAVMGLARRWRRPEVMAIGAVAVVMMALAFFPPVVALANSLPYRARLGVAVVLLAFSIAVLAGVGTDALVRWRGERPVLSWCAAGFGAAAFVLLELWFFGRGTLHRANAHLRNESFIWPAIEIVVGLAVMAALVAAARRPGHRSAVPDRRQMHRGVWAACALLLCETCFLVGVGASRFPSSSTFFAPTPAVTALQHSVGSSVVGFGARSCQVPPTIGIVQEANVGYGIHEFAAYDPIAPRTLFNSWQETTGQKASKGLPVSVFCPVVTTAALARLYGVAFVLEPHGVPGPPGAVFDEVVGDEELYRIPDSSQATVVPLSITGNIPPTESTGVAVPVSHPDPATWKIAVHAKVPTVLRLRLTAVPGWHASIDGRTLPLGRFAGVMLQARIPPGRHTVVLRYSPTSFAVGIGLALVAVLALGSALVVGRTRRRGKPGI